MKQVRLLIAAQALLLLTGLVTPLPAQVVRGVVRTHSGNPVQGALISLQSVSNGDTSRIRDSVLVLSGPGGSYAIRAQVSGSFRLRAKRIGVQSWQSDVFALGVGETRNLDIELDEVPTPLRGISVVTNRMCVTRGADAARIATLWEEASTALSATKVSLRDSLVEIRLRRYSRMLIPRNLRIVSETTREIDAQSTRTFTSTTADTLSLLGFWRVLPGDTIRYDGPDHEVLLSSEFLRDHCFRVIDGTRERASMIGLGFEPVAARRVPDIEGVLWLDRQSFDLQYVEFRYTGLPRLPFVERVGGEMHFGRLPTGAWAVRRWFLRMPMFSDPGGSDDAVRQTRPTATVRSEILRLVEEGGEVISSPTRLASRPGRIHGVIMDSSSRPLPGATIRLTGTSRETTAGNDGTFRFDQLMPGRYQLTAHEMGYTALGLNAASAEVTVTLGDSVAVTLQAARSHVVMYELCQGTSAILPRTGALVVHLVDSTGTGSSPIAGREVQVWWTVRDTIGNLATGLLERRFEHQRVAPTSDSGRVTFCDLPAETTLSVGRILSDGRRHELASVRLKAEEVAWHVIHSSGPGVP